MTILPSALGQAATSIARMRSTLGLTQAAVAQKAGIDQTRVSRIEKGEVSSPEDVERVLDALGGMGSKEALPFKEFASREWQHIEPPQFWNPQRASLEIAEEMLAKIEAFLGDKDHPWPLRRQVERHKETLLKASTFLTRLNHNIAFIGNIGVGKSTAISFIFELLVPSSISEKTFNRPILETGAGGTTICEVHIKGGPEFGISILPMSDGEMRDLISDFCASKWNSSKDENKSGGETVGVSREADRAIRNMANLKRKKETISGKPIYHDPVVDMMSTCANEEEFRAKVLERVGLPDRSRRELWYDSATRRHPMEWITETFKEINNGRLKDVPLPKSLDLLIPDFGRSFGELEISVVDTKGVDDVAVREDLDLRLRDPRTAVVFCSHFNDAPGTTARSLLNHMRQTFSERVDTGKVSILALPRSGEARAMKDDGGEEALSDTEGYTFKGMQVNAELTANKLAGVPIMFFNVESDNAALARRQLFGQLEQMREAVADRLFNLCAAADEIIENHEAQALNAAIEEVANRLATFLEGNRQLGARERLAHVEAINTVRDIRYASTLWAATRRNGEYSGLNIIHQVGIGAARDASLRGDSWFQSFEAFLKALKADSGLALARKNIEQIGVSALATRTSFLEAVQRAGMEVYREPLQQAPVWASCAGEWGRGPGFKHRVIAHLDGWFSANRALNEKLEGIVNSLWESAVVFPLRQLAEESAQTDYGHGSEAA